MKVNWFGAPAKKKLFSPVKLPTKKSVRKIPKKNLTYPQAVKRYPKIKAFGDADKDGKINMLDCKPFDRKKHGMTHQYSFSSTSSKRIKTVKMKPDTFLRETYKEIKAKMTPDGDLNEGFYKVKNVKLGTYKEYKEAFSNRPIIKEKMKKIKSKTEDVAIGFLDYKNGIPRGHEGRHTAVAAEKLGIKTIPVTVEAYLHEKIPETYNLPEHRKQIPLNPRNYNNETGEYSPSKDHVHNAKAYAAKYHEERISPENIDRAEKPEKQLKEDEYE